MGLRCNGSAMGLQVMTLGEGVEQRSSSKQRGMLLLQDLADPRAGKGMRGPRGCRWGLPLSSLPSASFGGANGTRSSSDTGHKLKKMLEYWPGFSCCNQESSAGLGRDKGARNKTVE